jgi:hypothetical protein
MVIFFNHEKGAPKCEVVSFSQPHKTTTQKTKGRGNQKLFQFEKNNPPFFSQTAGAF